MSIDELRLVLTVDDFARATAFFRDALGLKQLAAWENDGGHAVLLEAGHARRVAGQVRIAFRSSDSESAANTLVKAGATILAGPLITPWRDRNVRLEGPEGIQLTLFTPLGE